MVRAAAVAGALALVALFALLAAGGTERVGRPFPGFFLQQNRVVPSISLPAWDDTSFLFGGQVISVDGRQVSTADEVYEIVAQRPPGSRVVYLLRTGAGDTISASVAARLLSWRDYGLTLGALMLNGLLFVAIGLGVLWLRPERAATHALASACLSTGVSSLTAADPLAPHWMFALHAVAETLIAPAYIHLSLVFPVDRLTGRRRLTLAALYLPFMALAAWYLRALPDAGAYATVHVVATGAQGIAALCLLACLGTYLVGRSSALARRRVGVVALGTVAGLVLPGVLAAASAAAGGTVPINGGAFTAFLFPLSLAYAVVKQNLFEIDRMLRRAISYALVVGAITAAYLAVLLTLGAFFPASVFARSPATYAILNLALLIGLAPARERIRFVVDRLFFGPPYDADAALRELSQALASARGVGEVVQRTRLLLQDTLAATAAVYLREADGALVAAAPHDGMPPALNATADVVGRLGGGEVLARYEWDDVAAGRLLPPWDDRRVEIVVPLRRGERLIGLLVLGPKRSGSAHNARDVRFLQTLTTQMVMALTAAKAFHQLEELNAGLEEQVRTRTSALNEANAELQQSLEQLRRAYEQVERKQAGLLRADRLATVGRLAAGLAHEINTPLGAVMNSLKVVLDLTQEYAESIDDESVAAEDHRDIAAELLANARAADAWARKAAAFLSRTRAHGRDATAGARLRFPIAAVVEEVRGLLAHRLHATGCRLEYVEQSQALELVGDPSRLSQVLVNLVANAVDAYEERQMRGGLVRVAAERRGDKIQLWVRDWAGGIAPDVLPRIFDELFTTKEPGRGTGLGLWIARNLVEESFEGRMLVDSSLGQGSCFTAVLPIAEAGGESPPLTSDSEARAAQPEGGLAAMAGGG